MEKIMRSSVMLATILSLALLSAAGQDSGGASSPASKPTTAPPAGKIDLGITYTYKLAKVAGTTTHFGMQGASLDGAIPLPRLLKNLSVAFDISGEAENNIEPGVNIKQFSFVAGPRYSFRPFKFEGVNPVLYAEGLLGAVHASNSVFPAIPTTSSASSLAIQAGGGINLPVSQHLGLRVVAFDYIGTRLPNNTDTVQSDCRISSGFTFHF